MNRESGNASALQQPPRKPLLLRKAHQRDGQPNVSPALLLSLVLQANQLGSSGWRQPGTRTQRHYREREGAEGWVSSPGKRNCHSDLNGLSRTWPY